MGLFKYENGKIIDPTKPVTKVDTLEDRIYSTIVIDNVKYTSVKFTDEELKNDQEAKFHRLLINRVLTEGFVELLEWDEYHGWPETLAMDAHRFLALRDQLERAAMSTAVILLTFSNISGYVIPAHAQGLKITIKKHVDVLLEDFNDDTDLLKILPTVGLQVIQDINAYLTTTKKDVFSFISRARMVF